MKGRCLQESVAALCRREGIHEIVTILWKRGRISNRRGPRLVCSDPIGTRRRFNTSRSVRLKYTLT